MPCSWYKTRASSILYRWAGGDSDLLQVSWCGILTKHELGCMCGAQWHMDTRLFTIWFTSTRQQTFLHGRWRNIQAGIQLFHSLVRFVVLYGLQVWGPTTSSNWSKLEAIQKLFLEVELAVKAQTPYTLLLAEASLLPLQVEALYLTLQMWWEWSLWRSLDYPWKLSTI